MGNFTERRAHAFGAATPHSNSISPRHSFIYNDASSAKVR